MCNAPLILRSSDEVAQRQPYGEDWLYIPNLEQYSINGKIIHIYLIVPSVGLYPNLAPEFYTRPMAAKDQKAPPSGGRQAAYTARNRAALIKAGQEVLAEFGPSATIEQLAAHAQVSPTTIYKYFENKDKLFLEALGTAWESWLGWAATQNPTTDRFQRIINLGRRLFYVRQTHPLFAQMLHSSLGFMPDFVIASDQGEGKKVFASLAAAGDFKQDDFDKRYLLWTYIFSGLLRAVLVTDELSPDEAEVALVIGLSVFGVSEAKAKKLLSTKLVFELVK